MQPIETCFDVICINMEKLMIKSYKATCKETELCNYMLEMLKNISLSVRTLFPHLYFY